MTQIKKHIYEKPAMRVIKLNKRPHLLVGSVESFNVNKDKDTEEQW